MAKTFENSPAFSKVRGWCPPCDSDTLKEPSSAVQMWSNDTQPEPSTRKANAHKFANVVEADITRGERPDPQLGREMFGDWAPSSVAVSTSNGDIGVLLPACAYAADALHVAAVLAADLVEGGAHLTEGGHLCCFHQLGEDVVSGDCCRLEPGE